MSALRRFCSVSKVATDGDIKRIALGSLLGGGVGAGVSALAGIGLDKRSKLRLLLTGGGMGALAGGLGGYAVNKDMAYNTAHDAVAARDRTIANKDREHRKMVRDLNEQLIAQFLKNRDAGKQ